MVEFLVERIGDCDLHEAVEILDHFIGVKVLGLLKEIQAPVDLVVCCLPVELPGAARCADRDHVFACLVEENPIVSRVLGSSMKRKEMGAYDQP